MYGPIALVGLKIPGETLRSYRRKHKLTKATLRRVAQTFESEFNTPVCMAHLDDGEDISVFACCFAARQTNPKKRTNLTTITIPQEFLAIKDFLEIPSEIERIYGQGLIFGGEESGDEMYPSLA